MARDRRVRLTSQRGYVADSGAVCPVCGGSDVRGTGDPEFDYTGELSQPVECGICESTWVDRYTLSRYDTVVVSGEPGPNAAYDRETAGIFAQIDAEDAELDEVHYD